MGQITIRQIESYNEVLECEDIQQAAWNMSTPRDIVPAHILHPISKHGGLLLGAFDQDKLVGFVFGFVGWNTNQSTHWKDIGRYHCSEMMGILPEYWSRSIGYQLKLAQRSWLLNQGYQLVVWTYDPLLSRNAWLNFVKLGVICRTYIRDAYGQMSGLYAGLATDRFEVEWWIESKRAAHHLNEPVVPSITEWQENGAFLLPHTKQLGVEELETLTLSSVIIELPSDIHAMKEQDMPLAQHWRAYTRQLFETFFGCGYIAVGFATERSKQLSYYLLTKNYLGHKSSDIGQ